MFSFLESEHYFGTAKKEIMDNQFETEGVVILILVILVILMLRVV